MYRPVQSKSNSGDSHSWHHCDSDRHSPGDSAADNLTEFLLCYLRLPVLVVLLLALLISLQTGSASAAEVVGEEVYQLPEGHTVSDDLYVSAREVYVNGTVDGDLVVVAGYVEINGVVTGDVLAMAGNIMINGVVGDDARLMGAGIVLTGNVADDLLAAGGGTGFPQVMGLFGFGRNMVPGVRILSTASVTNDALLAGQTGLVDGAIGHNLFAAFDTFQLGGRIDGDADLYVDNLTVTENASVGGNLRYTSPQTVDPPTSAAGSLVAEPRAVRDSAEESSSAAVDALWWIVRTAMMVLGLALLGWMLARFFPVLLNEPLTTLRARPFESGLWGSVVVVLYIPVAAGLIFLATLFWRVLPGGTAMLALLFGLFSLFWIISPLLTGLWIGRMTAARFGLDWSTLTAMLVGMALIVVIARLLTLIPCAGALAAGLLGLLSMALMLGSLVLSNRENSDTSSAMS